MKLLDQFTRDESPLRLPDSIGEGITVNAAQGYVTAWVELPARSTDAAGDATLFYLTATGGRELRRYIPAGASGQIKVQWFSYSGKEYLEQELRRGMTPGQREYIELGAERVDQIRFPRRQVLLGVRFDAEHSSATKRRSPFIRKAKKAAGLHDISTETRAALDGTSRRARAWIERMAGTSFGARPATVAQIAGSLRRDLRRTVDWLPTGPIAQPQEIARLASTSVVPFDDHLEITTNEGIRFLRLLTLTTAGFPTTGLSLPDGTWLKDLNIAHIDADDEAAPDAPRDPTAGPVEVSIRFRNVPNSEALSRMENAITLAKSQAREAAQGVAGDAPDHVGTAQWSLSQRMNDVRARRTGMVEDAVTWVIEALDLETLNKRTTAAIDFYGDMGITLWEAPKLQDLLWKELIAGESLRIPEFQQFRPWDTLVGGWFHGGSIAGDDYGPYLAANRGSTPGPFRTRLSNAQRQGKSITSVFVGTTGSGKSTGVCLCLLAEVSTQKAWGALTDFKGDLNGLPGAAEKFGVNVTRISTDKVGAGTLDPFRWVPDLADAVSLVVDNLTVALPFGEFKGAEGVIRRFANRVAERPDSSRRSTHVVITELQKATVTVDGEVRPDLVARAVGDELAEIAKDALARPVMGPPDVMAKGLTTDPGLVYMNFVGMRWPGKETPREMWKAGHRLTIMLVQAGAAYLTYMAGRVKGIPKIVALTELHYLLRYDFGREFVSELALTGRALDVNLLLDTQGCRQLLLVEDLIDQLSHIFCFGVRSADEADAQAVLLGLEPEQGFRDMQVRQDWVAGERLCLVRDGSGRIAPIQFDYLLDEIEELLQTNPDRDENEVWDVAPIVERKDEVEAA